MFHKARFARLLLATGALSLAVSLVVAAPGAAHKAHHASTAGDSVAGALVADSVPARPAPAPPARAEAAMPFVMPPVSQALLEHPHNKLVHFPLALGLVAALLLVLGRRRADLDMAGRWLVRLAALGGVAAYLTGRVQEEAFDGEPKEWLVHLHENWGLATAIVLVIWAMLTFWKPARRYVWIWGLVAAALVLITAFYGGIVAHGE